MSTLWFALGLIGQAAALQAILAGKLIHYQHHLPLGVLVDEKPWAVIVLAFQLVLVGVGIANRWSLIWGWLKSNFRPWQLIVIILVVVLSSAALSASIEDY